MTYLMSNGLRRIADLTRNFSAITILLLLLQYSAFAAGLAATQARLYPRSDSTYAAKLYVGGQFQGAAVLAGPWTSLYTIPSNNTPAKGILKTYSFANTKSFKYLRYLAPNNSYAQVAELSFYAGTKKIVGPLFGSAGSGTHTYLQAFDGSTSTYFQASSATGAYVGVDPDDSISAVSGPTPVSGTGTVTVNVSYSASDTRTIVVNFQDPNNGYAWYGSGSTTVSTGSGTAAVSVSINGAPNGSTYWYNAAIQDSSGNSLGSAQQSNVTVGSVSTPATDALTSVSGPASISGTGTVTVNVGYSAAASRIIVVNFQDPNNNWAWYGSGSATVPAGTGTAAVSVSINGAPAGSTYGYYAQLQNSGGTALVYAQQNPVSVGSTGGGSTGGGGSSNGTTWKVNGRWLQDPQGNTLILRGWNDVTEQGYINSAWYGEIAKCGSNVVRSGWVTDKINDPSQNTWGASLTTLKSAIGWVNDNHMLSIVGVWDDTFNKFDYNDGTGNYTGGAFDHCVDWWVKHANDIVIPHQNGMLVNIANEPGIDEGDYAQFYSRYQGAISKLRAAGIHTPLVIDAPYGGNHVDVFFRHSNGNANVDDCVALVNGDPDHNLVFSWHLYSGKNDTGTYGIGTTGQIKQYIDQSIADNVCLIFGEFGATSQKGEGWNANTNTNYEYMIQYAQAQGIGWLPWIWSDYTSFSATKYAGWDSEGTGTGPGDSGRYGNWITHYDSAGTIFNWGQELSVTSPYSIQNTASRTAYENNGFK